RRGLGYGDAVRAPCVVRGEPENERRDFHRAPPCTGTVFRPLFFFLACRSYVAFFLDAGFLSRQVAQVVNPRTAHDAHLVHFDAVDVRGVERENALHADAVGDFTDGKHFRNAAAFYLNDHTAETLDALLVSFHDFVGYGNGIAALERGY